MLIQLSELHATILGSQQASAAVAVTVGGVVLAHAMVLAGDAHAGEDSLCVEASGDRRRVVVAVSDSHFGARAGESLIRAAARVLRAESTYAREELVHALERIDTIAGIECTRGDHSEAAVIAAVVEQGSLRWALIGDAVAYRLRAGAWERVSRGTDHFSGGRPAPLVEGDVRVEAGEARNESADRVVIASDGIEACLARDGTALSRRFASPAALLHAIAQVWQRADGAGQADRADLALVVIDPRALR